LRGARLRKARAPRGVAHLSVRRARRRELLPFLLVAVLAESLLPLVRGNFVALALTTRRHRFGSQGKESGANEDRRQLLSIQTLTHSVARAGTPRDSARGSFNPLFTAPRIQLSVDSATPELLLWSADAPSLAQATLGNPNDSSSRGATSPGHCSVPVFSVYTYVQDSTHRGACRARSPYSVANVQFGMPVAFYRCRSFGNASFIEACSSEGASSARSTAHHGC
jgi:hypothetical protein